MQKVIVYYAFKIMDGLFVGNSRALQVQLYRYIDEEKDFLLINKINYVINCASSELTCNGIGNILGFDWKDIDEQVPYTVTQIIVTLSNIAKISEVIDTASENGEGVLFCSVRGQSRALTALTAYLMSKLQWSLFKTLQFLNSRRRDFEIRAGFLKQLMNFQTDYFKDKSMSRDWSSKINNSEEVIQNTYLNSLQQPCQPLRAFGSLQYTYGSKQVVTWAETLVEQIENSQLKESNFTGNTNLKPILKCSIVFQKQRMLKYQRPISVCEQASVNFEDFLIQNLAATKKFQSPALNYLNFDNRLKRREKDSFTPIQYNNKERPKRPMHFPPDRKKIMTNTKQIMETYLNSQNNYSQVRGRSYLTPQKERARAASQQTPSPNRMLGQQKQLIIENTNLIKWNFTKKSAQFKIK